MTALKETTNERALPTTYLAVGVDHRQASAALRDAVFIDDGELPEFLGALLESAGDAGLFDFLAVSTCDRTEIWGRCTNPDQAATEIARALALRAGTDHTAALSQALSFSIGEEAIAQMARVTAALESQVIGEPEIPGQVKHSYDVACRLGTTTDQFRPVMDWVFATAKRVRRETQLGQRPVTIAASAIRVARDIHGKLDRSTGLLIGEGDMGDNLLRQFQTAGLSQLTVTTENPARAEAMAARIGPECHVASFDALEEALSRADIVISATPGRHLVLTEDLVRKAHRRRKRKPMFLIDAAVPADIEANIDRIDGVFRYDLADLEQVAMNGRADRGREADKAHAIVMQEVQRFHTADLAKGADMEIADLRAHFETERLRVLESVQQPGAAEATRLLINRLLHHPSTTLRNWEATNTDESEQIRKQALELVKKLFGYGNSDDRERNQ